MAALLLVDGVSWGNQQAGASSSVQRPDNCVLSPPYSCDRHTKAHTARCASSKNLIDRLDRLDSQLPRFPSHESMKGSGISRSRVILETRPTWSQPYHDEKLDTWEQPSTPGNGDTSHKITLFVDGQEADMRRSQRISPPYLSMSQSRRAVANGAVLQAASTPLRTKELKGTTNIYMGFAAIILGFLAILQKGGLLGNNNTPTELCSSCHGYGMRPCNLCKGKGGVTWEGKFTHTNLCPACLGARIRKCSDCGGFRMRKDEPPFSQHYLKARP